MNSTDTLAKTEKIIAELSEADKIELFKWLEKEVKNGSAGIEKTENVMGGAACIRQTRIPVWLLEQARRQGISEAEILNNYPQLTATDLANAWNYVKSHQEEIESVIPKNKANEDWFGMDEGKMWIADDFDETPQEIINAFEGN